jgi:hypothetical protein
MVKHVRAQAQFTSKMASSGFAELSSFLPVFFSFFVEGMTLGSSSFLLP